MKTRLIPTIVLIVLLKPGATAQGKSDGGSSGSQQSGFVYYLQTHRHIRYAATHVDSYSFTMNQLRDMGRLRMFGRDFNNETLVSTTLYFDRRSVQKPSVEPINLADYDLRVFRVDKEVVATPIDPDVVTKLGDEDTVLTINIQYIDSVPRYWAVNRDHDPFKIVRLKAAITQDSGVLSPRFLYNEFNGPGEGQRTTDQAEITNHNYRGRFPHFQHQLGIERVVPPPFDQIEPQLAQAIAVCQQARGNQAAELAAFNDAKLKYKDVEAAFEADLKTLHAQEDQNGTSNPTTRSQAEKVSKEFQTLYKDYQLMQLIYDELSNVFKTALNERFKKLGDARDSPEDIMDYIDAVLDLQAKYPRIVPTLPVNTFDETISETAIPIANKDSVANFYFKILHKTFVNQPVYYLPFHFGTWDYGTLTIPYRYRPAPKNRSVIAKEGTDSTTAAQSVSEGAISLAIYLGRKWGRTRFYEDPGQTHNTLQLETVFITGPTLAPLSAAVLDTTSRYINAKTGYNYSGPANIFAWSLGFGAVLEWKNINFGVFAGRDLPLVNNTGWIYANKTWFGFGIGVNLGMLASGKAGN